MKNNWKFSKFVYFYQLPQAIALYHALNIKVIFFASQDGQSLESKSFLDQMDKKTKNQLIRAGFLVRINDNEDAKLTEISQNETGKVDIITMYLLLAEKCNMACRYCFFEEGMTNSLPPMSLATVKKAIDVFAQWSSKDKLANILLYGGDPFTNKKALRYAIEYTQKMVSEGKLHKDSYVSIVSNGTLITKKDAAFLSQYKDLARISLSIDGPKDLNNEWRVFHNQKGGYDKAIRGYKILQDAGLEVGLSITLPPTNIPHQVAVCDWVLARKPSGISYNTMTDIPNLQMQPEYAERVADFMIETFLVFRKAGLYEDRMMRKVSSFIDGKRFLKDCCGYGQQIVVAPNGDIGVCHGFTADKKFFVANVHNLNGFTPHEDPTFQEWAKRSPVNMPACYDCPGVGICGGGCAMNAYTRHGNIWAVDDVFCPQTKKILEWMIRDLYEQM